MTANSSLVIALGEDVKDELVERTFVGLAGVGRLNIAIFTAFAFAFAFAFSYDGGVFW